MGQLHSTNSASITRWMQSIVGKQEQPHLVVAQYVHAEDDKIAQYYDKMVFGG